MVNSRYTKINGLILKDYVFGQFDTINGGAGAFIGFHIGEDVDLLQPKWFGDGNGMSHPRLTLIRSYNKQVPDFLQKTN